MTKRDDLVKILIVVAIIVVVGFLANFNSGLLQSPAVDYGCVGGSCDCTSVDDCAEGLDCFGGSCCAQGFVGCFDICCPSNYQCLPGPDGLGSCLAS